MRIARGAGLLAISVLILAGCDRAAEKHAAQGNYNPRRAFAPLTLPVPVNSYRNGDGAPGPDYWQNRADYKIAATLDPARRNKLHAALMANANCHGADACWAAQSMAP